MISWWIAAFSIGLFGTLMVRNLAQCFGLRGRGFWAVYVSSWAVGFLIGVPTGGDTYRQGQIDALSGVIKYELKTQPSGETHWVEKK